MRISDLASNLTSEAAFQSTASVIFEVLEVSFSQSKFGSIKTLWFFRLLTQKIVRLSYLYRCFEIQKDTVSTPHISVGVGNVFNVTVL